MREKNDIVQGLLPMIRREVSRMVAAMGARHCYADLVQAVSLVLLEQTPDTLNRIAESGAVRLFIRTTTRNLIFTDARYRENVRRLRTTRGDE